MPENPAGRADAEFYCLLSENARESGARNKKEPRRYNPNGCIGETPLSPDHDPATNDD
jgi:hypothetical protein